jgi:DNA-binding response OmpR family regulator
MATLLCIDGREAAATRRMVLEHQGYRVLTASTRREAWQVLQQEEIDCVIAQHNPPQFDVRAILAALRGSYPKIPIVLLAWFSPESGTWLADECLSNLDGPEALLAAVARALHRNHGRNKEPNRMRQAERDRLDKNLRASMQLWGQFKELEQQTRDTLRKATKRK